MKYTYWALGMLLGCLLLLTVRPAGEAHAHFCDDNYAEQQDRENCWWRYWNDLTTDADREPLTAKSTSASDGTFCDSYFTTQQEREDCWWRYWNDRPLVPIELSVEFRPDTRTPLTAAAQTSQQTSGQLCGSTPYPDEPGVSYKCNIRNSQWVKLTLPGLVASGLEQRGQYHLCAGKSHPGGNPNEPGVVYACNPRTGWVKVRQPQPGIDWAGDRDLRPPSEGNCAEGFTHWDPIKGACIRQFSASPL